MLSDFDSQVDITQKPMPKQNKRLRKKDDPLQLRNELYRILGVDLTAIPGLQATGYLTHATAFDQNDLPPSMIILGGGPIGLEFAQVYSRLGAEVTIVEMLPEILPREDPDVSKAVRESLEDEGIQILTGVRAVEVRAGNPSDEPDKKVVILEGGESVGAAEIFVATVWPTLLTASTKPPWW